MAKRSNWPYMASAVIVWVLLLGALFVSATHIIHSAQRLGVAGWQAYTTPALADALVIVGKLGRLDRFTPATRKSSMRVMLFGAALSFAANVYAGSNIGERAYGAILVIVAFLLENHAAKLKLRPAEAPVVVAGRRKCKPGCACGRHYRKPVKSTSRRARAVAS